MQESTPMVRVADAKALDAEPDQWMQALQSEPGRTRVADMILKLGGGDAAPGSRGPVRTGGGPDGSGIARLERRTLPREGRASCARPSLTPGPAQTG